MGDDEQLPRLEACPAAEEVEDGAGAGHAQLMRRAPGRVLEWLGVGVPLDADELPFENARDLRRRLREEGGA